MENPDFEEPPVRESTDTVEPLFRNELHELLLKHLDRLDSLVDKPRQIYYTPFEEAAIVKSCQITTALVDAWVRVVVDFKGSLVLNAAVVAYSREIEHHKIASLSSLHEWAVLLGNQEAAALLAELLKGHYHFDQNDIDGDDGMTCDRYGQKVSSDIEEPLPGFSGA